MKKLCMLALAAMLCVSLCGCGRELKYTEYAYESFDTVTAFTAYAESREEFEKYKEILLSQLARYDALFDIYEHHEGYFNLYDLNNISDRAEKAATDPEIAELLSFCKEMYYETDGKVNCAMGRVLRKWHDAREDLVLPNMDELQSLNEYSRIEDLVIEGDTVRLNNEVLTLDVGATAKGFACEKIAQSIEDAGCKAFILSMGGNVVTRGGRIFNIGVQSSDGVSVSLVLESENEAIVTSGGYNRYAEIDGKIYHHIIDAETLMPADKVKSATVICDSSARADALSTYFFQLEPENALAQAEKLGVRVVIEDNSGNILYSEGVKIKKQTIN